MNLTAIISPAQSAADAVQLDLRPAAVNTLNKRQRAKAATRARVLAGARQLFTQVGYFDTGIRDVANHIGRSTGAVFATVPDKETLWRQAMGGPPPSGSLAEEVALLLALRPGWGWLLKHDGKDFFATLTSPDYDPTRATGQIFIAPIAESPAAALRKCRLNCDAFNAGTRQ